MNIISQTLREMEEIIILGEPAISPGTDPEVTAFIGNVIRQMET